jgi:hypothetical protein
MANSCYVVIHGAAKGKRIGIVVYRQSGYYHTDYDVLDETEADCEEHVKRLNKSLGVSPQLQEAMFSGSMFGWNCPAASPAVDHFNAQRCVERSL